MAEGVFQAIYPGWKVPDFAQAAVEGDESYFMRSAGDLHVRRGVEESIEKDVEGAIVLKLARCGSAGLHENYDGQWLPIELFGEEGLLDAIVGEMKILSAEIGDERAGAGLDKRGYDHQARSGGDGGLFGLDGGRLGDEASGVGEDEGQKESELDDPAHDSILF